MVLNSSGITYVYIDGSQYTFPQHSGSEYVCRRDFETLSSLTASIYESYKSRVPEGVVFEIISFEDFLKEWKHG